MAEIVMPYHKTQNFIDRIPRQREMIGRLLQTGVLNSFSLNADRTKCWMVIFAENEESAMHIIEQFPMYEFMSVELFPLLVTDRAPAKALPLVLN